MRPAKNYEINYFHYSIVILQTGMLIEPNVDKTKRLVGYLSAGMKTKKKVKNENAASSVQQVSGPAIS